MSILNLQQSIVYGPVHSRRLGISLGINLLPKDLKVCTFNCLYCQYGWTDFSKLKSASFPDVQTVLHAVDNALQYGLKQPQYITFSGNGEPTLHPDFPQIVDGIIALRNKWTPLTKTAILSNSTTLNQPDVRDALHRLDVRIMKLDAGTSRIFKQFNKPTSYVTLKTILNGLRQLNDVTIQALFTGGCLGNYQENHLTNWLKQIEKLNPSFVQIYSLDRGFPSKHITALEPAVLLNIKRELSASGINSFVF